MRPPRQTYEHPNAFGSVPDADHRSAPAHAGSRVRTGGEGPNGAARMAYAEARLRKTDEARSVEPERDPRIRIPDADEETTRMCGAPRATPSPLNAAPTAATKETVNGNQAR